MPDCSRRRVPCSNQWHPRVWGSKCEPQLSSYNCSWGPRSQGPRSQVPGCWEGFPAAPLPGRHLGQPPGGAVELSVCHQPEPCLRVRVTRKSRTPLPLSLSGWPPGWPRRWDRPGRRIRGPFILLLFLSHEVVAVECPVISPPPVSCPCDAAPPSSTSPLQESPPSWRLIRTPGSPHRCGLAQVAA